MTSNDHAAALRQSIFEAQADDIAACLHFIAHQVPCHDGQNTAASMLSSLRWADGRYGAVRDLYDVYLAAGYLRLDAAVDSLHPTKEDAGCFPLEVALRRYNVQASTALLELGAARHLGWTARHASLAQEAEPILAFARRRKWSRANQTQLVAALMRGHVAESRPSVSAGRPTRRSRAV